MLSKIFHALPGPMRKALNPIAVPLVSYRQARSPGARWVGETYFPFGRSERERLLLGIMRFCHINRPLKGYYFEFGCHSGSTMRMTWKHSRHLFDWTYVGFDSFEGLPDVEGIDKIEVFQKGKMATSEYDFVNIMLKAGMPRDRLRTVSGFYDKTLTPELAESLAPGKAALIYVDCDLYASTKPVLEFVKSFLQEGTVIVFDDWFCFRGRPDRGEQLAFREFRECYPDLQFVPFVQTCEAQSFIFVGPRGVDQSSVST
jgi:O-methyltransferase